MPHRSWGSQWEHDYGVMFPLVRKGASNSQFALALHSGGLQLPP